MVDAFYFRVNQDNQLYFTETENDTVILGNMIMTNFEPRPGKITSCFNVNYFFFQKYFNCLYFFQFEINYL